MTFADIWRQEGMKLGRKEGIKIGKVKSEMAKTLLTNKLGPLPDGIKQSLLNVSVVKLDVILTNIFTIESIDEVKGYLK